jgi:DNA-binding XRE family transcriptional regulator
LVEGVTGITPERNLHFKAPSRAGLRSSKQIRSAKHEALRTFTRELRKAPGLTQAQLAKRLNRYQSYITMIEGGELRIGVLELIDLAQAIGLDPPQAIKRVAKID